MPPSPGTDPARPRLARSLTLTHAVLYGLGVTIGAGIYVLVGIAAGRAGVHAPLAFVAAAIVMVFSAATFAELGTRLPVSASEAAYVQAAFNRRRLALAVGLLSIATSVVSAATIAVGSAGYLGVFIALPPHWIITGVILAMGAIAALAAVHAVGMAGAMTLVEVGGLLLIIGAGLGQADVVTRLPEIVPAFSDAAAWAGIGSTALLAVFAFIGFEHLVNISEEIRDQRRNLPRALFITLAVTAALYALVIWIAVIAVPPPELAASPAPLALVFERLTGWPIGAMSAIAAIATLNGVIVSIIIIARITFGLADQGQLPAPLAWVHPRTRSPLPATALAVVLILVLALAVPLEGLAGLTATGTLLIFAMVNLALIRIRWRETAPPPGIFLCPRWVPYAGLATSLALLAIDLAAR